jgi:YaiO family outer membrane protein
MDSNMIAKSSVSSLIAFLSGLSLVLPLYCYAEANPTTQPTTTKSSQEQTKSQPSTLTDIKELMQKHELNKAKTEALDHLKSNPNDVDVMLMLGLIYYKQAEYKEAEASFHQVLDKTPTYLDAKIGLIRTEMAQHKYKEASILIKEAIKQAPDNSDLKEIEHAYKSATEEHKVAEKAKKKAAAKKAKHLAEKKEEVLNPIDEELMYEVKRFTERAERFYRLHLYSQSAEAAQKALAIDPNYGPAKEVLGYVKEISPNKLWGRNDIGISSTNEFVSDLRQNWDYSQLHLSRDTDLGTLTARVTYAHRQHEGAYQKEVEFVPVITPYLFFDLYYAHANAPALFPEDTLAAEVYGTIPKVATLSVGEYSAHILGDIAFKRTTTSISRDIGNNWLAFRVNHYVPNLGQNSTLYIANFRHYFHNLDCFFSITGGWGKSPDLADLLTTNFIVIKNRFIFVNFRFPLFDNRLLVDIGADYQNWKYPTNLDRSLTGGTLGLSYRF